MKRCPVRAGLILFLLMTGAGASFAQTSYTISGSIKDKETGEDLIGASVVIGDVRNLGVSSNSYGFYSLAVPEGTHIVLVEFIGYRTTVDTLQFSKDTTINFALSSEAVKIKEVVVSGERSNKNVTSTEMSTNKLDVHEINTIPVLLGEKDILKTIQLLPGIEAAGEGSTGFYARGGGIDQNLIMLDEATVYNSSHLLGFLSVFNSDAVKDVKIMTGGIPAEYGGRLSSVLDIRTNDGNMKEYTGSGGVGLLASRLTFGGPIVTDEGSFNISARRTYADLFLRLSTDTTINRASLYFYDLNAKANYTLGVRDRVYISGYFGRDNFAYPNFFGFNWGNETATLRWNHIFADHLFSNTSLIYSNYEYSNNVTSGTSQFSITSGIQDVNFKTDFQYFVNAQNTVKFGANAIYHTFLPGTVTATAGSTFNGITIPNRYASENAAYVSHEADLSSRFRLDYGLRFSVFSLLGPAQVKTYDSAGDILSTASYGSGEFIKTYTGLEPRVSLNFLIDETSSMKASYTRTSQYLHLLSNSVTSNPSDLWVPSSNNVKPQYADQVAVGYFRNFADNGYEASVELYYKNMQNEIDYKNGADLQLNPDVEALLTYGRGWSYGSEWLIRKKYGKITGWIGYTLSRTDEQFPDINNGQPFPARQDRTHDISVVAIYEYSEAWTFSATWVYNTGNAVTFPSGNYLLEGVRLVPYYTERNGYRMPAYHRLDLSATWTLGPHSNINFSIYNAYDRWNAYSIYFQRDPVNPNLTQAVQTTFFPLIPSATYNFSF
ncbi:MAG TPA: TonB-dependent receptor [Bacteroidota bacterium]|nr:TonB-dependent receptor [Bacteroidota bacterium]